MWRMLHRHVGADEPFKFEWDDHFKRGRVFMRSAWQGRQTRTARKERRGTHRKRLQIGGQCRSCGKYYKVLSSAGACCAYYEGGVNWCDLDE